MCRQEWVVQVPKDLEQELAESFQMGPIVNGNLRKIEEQLVAQLNGLKIEIFANEHPPPHFRVRYAGETADYAIADCQQLSGGLSKWYKNVKKWHQKNKDRLISVWNATRPTDCPVGAYRGH